MIDLPFRIRLLSDAEQISPAEADGLTAMLKMFAEKWHIELNEDNAGMFITHLAIALKRMRENDTIQALDCAIIDEIQASVAYPQSVTAMNEIESLFNVNLSDSEKGYIYLHLNKYFE